MASQPLIYTGAGRAPGPANPQAPAEPEPYVASPDLVRAVNLAIFLRRPLLIEGEAGCGKSRLARAVAYELNLPYYQWPVRSTSRALDGLYTYDAILRLHDVHTSQLGGQATAGRDPSDARAYRRFGALGQAFRTTERPAVVLIDEIDKADVDFPNDLLNVLEETSFDIPETGEPIRADYDPPAGRDNRPIVIITSNNEKGNLPAPFLRRCIYHYISFPTPEDLERIVAVHFSGAPGSERPADVAGLTKRFMELRKDSSLFKKPGTSEFLDWVRALVGFPQSGSDRPDVPPGGKLLPYRGLLLKRRQDWQSYQEPGESPA